MNIAPHFLSGCRSGALRHLSEDLSPLRQHEAALRDAPLQVGQPGLPLLPEDLPYQAQPSVPPLTQPSEGEVFAANAVGTAAEVFRITSFVVRIRIREFPTRNWLWMF